MGWEPGADKERRAQELLDKNAAIIFKLSGERTQLALLSVFCGAAPVRQLTLTLPAAPAVSLLFPVFSGSNSLAGSIFMP